MKTSENLPSSIKTLRRAQLLLLLDEVEPTTNHHLVTLAKSKISIVRRIFREFSLDGLVYEKHHLYRLTSKGRRVLQKVIDDPIMVDFVKEQEMLDHDMQRPTVTRMG